MSIFSITPAVRAPHDEPGFNEAEYVAEYSDQTQKHASAEHAGVLDFVSSRFAGRERLDVLDIGSGPGWIAIRLAQAHPRARVTGIDVSPQFVTIANENKEREGVGERVEFVVGDASHLERFADQSFDLVISNQSLHYWPEPSVVFNEIARVLRPEGGFCISDDRRDLSWLGRLQVVLGRRALSTRIGASWRRSLDGCFSSSEVADMLQRSALRDRWTMSLRPRGMLITSR